MNFGCYSQNYIIVKKVHFLWDNSSLYYKITVTVEPQQKKLNNFSKFNYSIVTGK